jgi:heat shock protein HslJ
MKRLTLVLTVLAVLLAAACGADQPLDTGSGGSGGSDLASPEGTWQLVEGSDAAGAFTPVDGYAVTVDIDAREVRGNAGCNTYGGAVTRDGGGLAFADLFQTEMACADPAPMQIETRYLAALGAVTGFAIEAGSLVLNGAGVRLVFAPAGSGSAAGGGGSGTGGPSTDLSDAAGEWALDSLVEGDAVSHEANFDAIVLTVQPDGTFGMQMACNSAGGRALVAGGEVAPGDIASTLIGCDEARLATDGRLLAALGAVATWEVSGDRLTLSDAGGPRLILIRA